MSTTAGAPRRSAFFLSDRTGITIEMLGHSLLRQFENLSFAEVTLPYLDTAEKATAAVIKINDCAIVDGVRPLIFSTFVNPEIRSILDSANAFHLDCFNIFISSLEAELGTHSSRTVGRSHRVDTGTDYGQRIEAVRYTLEHDDGISHRNWQQAGIILIGVSRSGKTPTCLYLALQYGIRAANYPLTPDDFRYRRLPAELDNLRDKLFGFTTDPVRLHQIRNERKPGSGYASLKNCEYEVREAEALMRQEGIPYLDATNKSIEELATAVLHQAKLGRRIY
ncbi:pyruvate, water dikinase regulatory protein [Nitrosospira sp. NpAV]|uniref:posphoenolpyruvate synthetase regulatory kinase/phosphorylase PpsR n=1 Tax=Nitrosospira sp. NpAV TaxID=58133 RepID=UPI0005A0E5E2|nr:pyruvate, water dikinase regulatory protein [Nitrosospira sp. NpAV]KIO49858.1 PEP synthetase regulatory protein [Nitrosospira sp. NpAV]